jgi:hypothetical protein
VKEISTSDNVAARDKLKLILREVIESIYVMPEKHGRDIYVLAQINYRNGKTRQVAYFRNRAYITSYASPFLDLRNQKNIDGEFFIRLKKELETPSKNTVTLLS